MISSKSETKISLQLTRNISCSAISATWSTCHHEKAGDQRLVDNMCVSADAMQCEIHECKNDVDLCYVMYLYLYRYLVL